MKTVTLFLVVLAAACGGGSGSENMYAESDGYADLKEIPNEEFFEDESSTISAPPAQKLEKKIIKT
ncbi:MAG: hypothetical protein AAF789_04640 [Bacteroidota bacterium]